MATSLTATGMRSSHASKRSRLSASLAKRASAAAAMPDDAGGVHRGARHGEVELADLPRLGAEQAVVEALGSVGA